MADSADSEGKRRGRRDSPPDGIELSSKTRALIHGFHARLVEMNLFEVLGVDSDADLATLRRGYFERSKQFHPDRYFNKNIGHYKKLLEHIFQWVSAAFKFLKDDTKREAYRQRLHQSAKPEQQPVPQQQPQQPVEAKQAEQPEAEQQQKPPAAAPAAKPVPPIVVPVERDSGLEFEIADEDDFYGKPAAAPRTPTPPPVAQQRSPTPPPVAQQRSPTPPPVPQRRSPTPPPVPRPRSPTPPPVDPPTQQPARAPREERTQADDTLEFYVDD